MHVTYKLVEGDKKFVDNKVVQIFSGLIPLPQNQDILWSHIDCIIKLHVLRESQLSPSNIKIDLVVATKLRVLLSIVSLDSIRLISHTYFIFSVYV